MTQQEDRRTCEASLRGGSAWSRHTSACGKTAKFEREGKWYCGTHDPVAVAAKRDKRNEEHDKKSAERMRVWRLHSAAEDLLAACKAAAKDSNVSLSVREWCKSAIAKAEKP